MNVDNRARFTSCEKLLGKEKNYRVNTKQAEKLQ